MDYLIHLCFSGNSLARQYRMAFAYFAICQVSLDTKSPASFDFDSRRSKMLFYLLQKVFEIYVYALFFTTLRFYCFRDMHMSSLYQELLVLLFIINTMQTVQLPHVTLLPFAIFLLSSTWSRLLCWSLSFCCQEMFFEGHFCIKYYSIGLSSALLSSCNWYKK